MSPKKKLKQTHSETSDENVLFCCYKVIKTVVVVKLKLKFLTSCFLIFFVGKVVTGVRFIKQRKQNRNMTTVRET